MLRKMGSITISTLFLTFLLMLQYLTNSTSAEAACPSQQQIKSEMDLISLSPQCFGQRYMYEKHNGNVLSREINERIANYKRLLQDIKMGQAEHLETHPVIKWAQSQTQIFLSLRLSHRHDSPTCSDIRKQLIKSDVANVDTGDLEFVSIADSKSEENTSPSFQESHITSSNGSDFNQSSRFLFQSRPYFILNKQLLGECFFTHQKLMFSLDLNFNSTISKLSVKKESFGRYSVVGTKQVEGIWMNPFNGYKKAGIWTEMRNKYEKDMDRYFEMMEELNENKPSKAKKKFRTKEAQMKYQMSGEL